MTTEFESAVKTIYERIKMDASSEDKDRPGVLPLASALCELQRAIQLHEMEAPGKER